jgi:hypothetical protein
VFKYREEVVVASGPSAGPGGDGSRAGCSLHPLTVTTRQTTQGKQRKSLGGIARLWEFAKGDSALLPRIVSQSGEPINRRVRQSLTNSYKRLVS